MNSRPATVEVSPPAGGVSMSAPVTKASEPLGAGAWILGVMVLAGTAVCLVLAGAR